MIYLKLKINMHIHYNKYNLFQNEMIELPCKFNMYLRLLKSIWSYL
jgi:hypothetical protein